MRRQNCGRIEALFLNSITDQPAARKKTQGGIMKRNLLTAGLVLASFLFAGKLFACQADLLTEDDTNIILATFYGNNCREASDRCNHKLRKLRRKYPGS